MKTKLTRLSASLLTLALPAAAHAQAGPAAATPGTDTNAPSAGLANDWLRRQAPEFSAWDFGGQLRARWEHKENFAESGETSLPGKVPIVDFRSANSHGDNSYLLLRATTHLGYQGDWFGAYLEGRDHAPTGAAWEQALDYWRTLPTDPGATFAKEVVIDAGGLAPFVTWGTNPAQVVRIDGNVPVPDSFDTPAEREAAARALEYMGLVGGTPLTEVPVDTVFIGSCTNGRIEDLRAAADVLRGRTVKAGMRALVVPGSHRVKAQAEAEGLDVVFTGAGFDWREPGCSMCLAMNPDKLAPGERSASTSNRNFEGRQGRGGRTHLVSPAVAAATAVAGRFATPGELN